MKPQKDRFSTASDAYRKFRPEYPPALYAYLWSQVPGRERALDAGTGNGQVAKVLARKFEEVIALDISAAQLKEAPQLPNVRYQVGRMEDCSLPAASVDLITVAQAYHWFDFAAFGKVARRLLKPDGRVAVWGYGLLRINAVVDGLVDHYYEEVIGAHWDAERRHIDTAYREVGFDFEEMEVPGKYFVGADWRLADLEGYLGTWSGLKRYREAEGKDPLPELVRDLEKVWPNRGTLPVRIPIFMRLGKLPG